MQHEHDDELAPSVEPRNEVATEELPAAADDVDSEQLDAETDDETVME